MLLVDDMVLAVQRGKLMTCKRAIQMLRKLNENKEERRNNMTMKDIEYGHFVIVLLFTYYYWILKNKLIN